MAYSSAFADRVRDLLQDRGGLGERRMFGALVFTLNGNIACGTRDEHLLVRLEREDAEAAVARPGVRPMTMGGRTSKGFVHVDFGVLEDDAALAAWVDAGADFAATLPPKP